jgi:hypothetical protein
MGELPTFLVIGATRSGTTWLHSVLSRHPDIFVPDKKELNFFNERILKEDLQSYFNDFDPGDHGPRPVRGDMSVNYSILRPAVVERIKRLLPDVRLVFTLRNPVDRMWSALKYDHSFLHRKALDRVPMLAFMRECESPRLRRRTDYQLLIQTWERVFGLGSLHIDLFDRLQKDPAGYTRDILWHLGADHHWQVPADLLTARINVSADVQIPPILRWYLSRAWLEPTRRLNDFLEGFVTPWLAPMEEDAKSAPLSWRIMRELNRTLLSLPNRLAYHAYDAGRQRALVRRCDHILARLPNAPACNVDSIRIVCEGRQETWEADIVADDEGARGSPVPPSG